LAGLEDLADEYEDAGVRVVAASADGRDGARKMKEEEDLGFPVLYGLDVAKMRDRLGLYINEGEKTHLQPAQFVLDPDGRVRLACYQSGAVGRLGPEEALGVVEFARG
jgi:peroxiredoxin